MTINTQIFGFNAALKPINLFNFFIFFTISGFNAAVKPEFVKKFKKFLKIIFNFFNFFPNSGFTAAWKPEIVEKIKKLNKFIGFNAALKPKVVLFSFLFLTFVSKIFY